MLWNSFKILPGNNGTSRNLKGDRNVWGHRKDRKTGDW